MMTITERTQHRLVVQSKPRAAFGIAISLGAVALLAALHSLVIVGEAPSTGTVAGLILGPLFLVGGLLLYRETTTVLDRRSGTVTWEQRGLIVRKADAARLDQIRDVVAGRPVSQQSGGPTRLVLVLEDRTLPLMFGFSAINRDAEIREAITSFIRDTRS